MCHTLAADDTTVITITEGKASDGMTRFGGSWDKDLDALGYYVQTTDHAECWVWEEDNGDGSYYDALGCAFLK